MNVGLWQTGMIEKRAQHMKFHNLTSVMVDCLGAALARGQTFAGTVADEPGLRVQGPDCGHALLKLARFGAR
jgi:hypothetical protein